ncbi:translation machinery-associated protein 22 [Cucumis melo var. makuwa]|uniref:Translation machinery-associated protein 22 n=1 Tax=Cucumis melo var. makuwa TaxID=1194695 RepID=A0A5D3CIK5_CUCMM|nr:translation machinery-associated protein 22 [Cucumis melo var. makuwa]
MNPVLLSTRRSQNISNTFPSKNLPQETIELYCTLRPKQEEVKRLPGGKIKKKDKQEVVIEKVTRNKRKCITTVKGLDLFGVKLSDASKKLGKKFATGASVVKGPTEKEQIDVQGDIAYDIVDFITETWPDHLSVLRTKVVWDASVPHCNGVRAGCECFKVKPPESFDRVWPSEVPLGLRLSRVGLGSPTPMDAWSVVLQGA